MKTIIFGENQNAFNIEPHEYITSNLYDAQELENIKSVAAIHMRTGKPVRLRLPRIIPDLTDYDLIVAYMGKIDKIGSYALFKMHQEIRERIRNGGVLLCFVDKPKREGMAPFVEDNIHNYDWLPIDLGPRARSGNLINVPENVIFEPILSQYLSGYKWVCDFDPPNIPGLSCTALARNNNNHPIALYYEYERGKIILLPSVSTKKTDKFLERFIKEIMPQLAPQLFQDIPTEEPPSWLGEWICKIPKVQKLSDDIIALESQIKELQGAQQEKLLQKQSFEHWGDLLWQTGEAILEMRVREAMSLLLGVSVQKKDVIDVVIESADGTFYAEVEGTKKWYPSR